MFSYIRYLKLLCMVAPSLVVACLFTADLASCLYHLLNCLCNWCKHKIHLAHALLGLTYFGNWVYTLSASLNSYHHNIKFYWDISWLQKGLSFSHEVKCSVHMHIHKPCWSWLYIIMVLKRFTFACLSCFAVADESPVAIQQPSQNPTGWCRSTCTPQNDT